MIEYQIIDLIRIIMKKGHVILFIMVLFCGVSIIVAEKTHEQAMTVYNEVMMQEKMFAETKDYEFAKEVLKQPNEEVNYVSILITSSVFGALLGCVFVLIQEYIKVNRKIRLCMEK